MSDAGTASPPDLEAEQAPSGSDLQFVTTQGGVEFDLSVQGVEEGATGTLEVKKAADDSSLATLQLEVRGGRARARWHAELDPEGGERGLRVYYVAEVDTFRERSAELEVYLDYVDIESQDAEGNPLPDATYRLRVSGPGAPADFVRTGRTGTEGKFRESDVPPGEVLLEWTGGCELIEWVDDTGPTRKAKLKKVNRVKFAWPDPEGEGGKRCWLDDGSELPLHERYFAHTQLVNYTADDATRAEHPERGHVLRLRITAWDREKALAGDKVFLKVEWPPADQLSPRAEPRRELIGGRAGVEWAPGDGVMALETTIPADQGEAVVEVCLGRAGGDTCTISIGATRRCEDAKLVVTNRREVFYQVTRRADQAMPDLDHPSVSARRYLAEGGFVDLAPDGDDVIYEDAPPLTGGAWAHGLTVVPRAWFEAGAAGDAVVIGAHNFAWFKETKFLARSGRLGLHFVLADRMLHGVQPEDGSSPYEQAFRDSWWNAREVDGEVVTDLEYFCWLPNTGGGRLECFPRAFHDGGPPLRGTWSTPDDEGLEPDLRGKSGPIDDAWVTADRDRVERNDRGDATAHGKFGVWVGFPEDSVPGRALRAGVNVDVAGTISGALTGVLGLSGWEQVVLSLADFGEAVQNHIVAHEVGHNLRQAACKEGKTPDSYYLPPGLTFGDHPHGYVRHGHLGSHCSEGLTPAERARDDYRALEGTCVMFGSTNDSQAAKATGFCAHCRKFLQAFSCVDVHRDAGLAAIGETCEVELAPAISRVEPARDRRWYVNLPQSDSGHAGRHVTLRARLTPPAAGTTVHFTLERGDDNKADLPTANRGGLVPTAASTAAVADTLEVQTDSSGVATCALRLSTYGGDRFRVSAGLAAECGEDDPKTGWVTVWRRLQYEVDAMLRSSSGSFGSRFDRDAFERKFAAAFVQWERVGTDSAPANRHMLLNSTSEVTGFATPLRQGSGSHYLHALFVDTLGRTARDAVTEDPVRVGPFTGRTLRHRLGSRADFVLDVAGDDWFVRGKVRKDGQELVSRTSQNLSTDFFNFSDNVTLEVTEQDYYLNVSLEGISDDDDEPLDPRTSEVVVEVTVKKREVGSGVAAGETATVVGMRWRELSSSVDDPTASTLKTVCHEIGHMLGLAAHTLPAGTNIYAGEGVGAADATTSTYAQNGNHCKRTVSGKGCIMYHAATRDGVIPTDFCDACTDALRGRILSRLPVRGNAGYSP